MQNNVDTSSKAITRVDHLCTIELAQFCYIFFDIKDAMSPRVSHSQWGGVTARCEAWMSFKDNNHLLRSYFCNHNLTYKYC